MKVNSPYFSTLMRIIQKKRKNPVLAKEGNGQLEVHRDVTDTDIIQKEHGPLVTAKTLPLRKSEYHF